MSTIAELTPSTLDRIRSDLAGLKMPRALEALEQIMRRLEHAEINALGAIDILLAEELTLRENSRIKTALHMGRLATIKTLAGFDFSFQPSLDRDRILTLAQLGFVARNEVVHFREEPSRYRAGRRSGESGPQRLLLHPGRPAWASGQGRT
jgi:DNA replication protein DnaC